MIFPGGTRVLKVQQLVFHLLLIFRKVTVTKALQNWKIYVNKMIITIIFEIKISKNNCD